MRGQPPVAARDNSTPAAPPARQISRLSAICSRMSVNRCAPRALRIAISFLPRCAARHQQIGHVEAADQQHAATAHMQDEQRLLSRRLPDRR